MGIFLYFKSKAIHFICLINIWEAYICTTFGLKIMNFTTSQKIYKSTTNHKTRAKRENDIFLITKTWFYNGTRVNKILLCIWHDDDDDELSFISFGEVTFIRFNEVTFILSGKENLGSSDQAISKM